MNYFSGVKKVCFLADEYRAFTSMLTKEFEAFKRGNAISVISVISVISQRGE